jgi:hypothetical protein
MRGCAICVFAIAKNKTVLVSGPENSFVFQIQNRKKCPAREL